jgi:hypothetical protein
MSQTCTFIGLILILLLFPDHTNSQQLFRVNATINNCVFRPTDGMLYASQSDNNYTEHSLVRIDQKFGTTEKLLTTTASWYLMELSDDGSLLYAAEPDKIVRYNFLSGVINLTFKAQLTAGQIYYPIQILPLPGAPESAAILWSNPNTNYHTIAIYDNGVRRPNTLEDVYEFGHIALNADGTQLYVYNRYTSASGIQRIAINATGVSKIPDTYHYIYEFSQSITRLGSRIFGSDGTVVEIKPDGSLKMVAKLNNPADINKPVFVQPVELSNPDTFQIIGNIVGRLYRQTFDGHNYQLLKTEQFVTIPEGTDIYKVIPLSHAGDYAILGYGKMYLFRICNSTITSVPPLAKPVYYQCTGDTLSIEAPGNYSDNRYFWSDGQLGKTYRKISSGNFNLSYQITDDQGCLSAPSAPSSIQQGTVPSYPYVNTAYAHTPVICAGGGFVELVADAPFWASAAGQTFIWSDGQIGQNIRVETNGSYTCRMRSPEGCLGQESAPIDVFLTAAQQPAKPALSIAGGNGDPIVCSADSATLQAPAGYNTYFWSDGFQSADNFRSITQSAKLSVWVKNNAGCKSENSDPIEVQYVISPEKPIIVRAENILGSNAAAGNQWFLDGVPIPGATDQYLTATQAGKYQVQVRNSAGCASPLSDPIQF